MRILILIGALAAGCLGGCPAANAVLNAATNGNGNANANSNSNENSNSSRLDPTIAVPGTYVGIAECDSTVSSEGVTSTSTSSNAVTVVLDNKNTLFINGIAWTRGASIGTAPAAVFVVKDLTTTSDSILISFSSSQPSVGTTGEGSYLLSWVNDKTIRFRQNYDTVTSELVPVQSQGGTVTTGTRTKVTTQVLDCDSLLTR